MKKERMKNIIAITGVILAVILVLTGCGKKEENNKKEDNTVQNQTANTENNAENTASKEENSNTTKENTTKDSSTKKDTSSENTTKNKATTPSKLMVNREGMSEEEPSKEYSSSYGYTIRYATDNFKVSNHDNADWFECEGDTNCVVVEKENTSYSKKVASLSNYKKTTVNGYEAVYTTKKAEGQAETTYYVNVGKDYIYEITTSCQDTSEYLEGLGHIMDAMVQTFAVK